MIPWWACSLIGAVAVIVMEYMNRTRGYVNFGAALLETLPLILITQWMIFRSWQGAPTLMLAWAVWFVATVVLRTGMVKWGLAGEPLSLTALGGVALIALGAYLVKVG